MSKKKISKTEDCNIYRKTKLCSQCPFLTEDGSNIHLRSGRLDDIKKSLLEDDTATFPCHKTIYNLDEDGNSTPEQEAKMCAGAYEFLQREGMPNIQMRMAYSLGIDSPPKEEGE